MYKYLTLFAVVLSFVSCQKNDKILADTDLSAEALIPKPLSVKATNSSFTLNSNTSIKTSDSEEFKRIGDFLALQIESVTGYELAVNEGNFGVFINQLESTALTNKEGYELAISKDSIVINALTGEGAFRAVQTLRQLIPYGNVSHENAAFSIPTGTIVDEPNFEYRGSMLDVARHFFTVEDVKKYIDVMAYYKMNYLHLHLSDDQGWRLEIKSWPDLAEIGGHTEVGGESGGFFTQEDYTEIVNYAAENFITVIPEIDMPGHTHAASTAYPQLNGNKDTTIKLESTASERKANLYTGIEVGFSTFDTRKEEVYDFIDDVIREIAELTPGPYIHMGGDESLVTAHDDYVYFVERVEKIIHKYGKTMIGWDEVATANINSNAIVQFWAEEENAKLAQEKGMKLILSPAKKIYLDMKYDTISKFGLHWAAYIPVDSAYKWTPETYVKGLPKEQILGIEAPLWSETISNIEELEYLAFPRLIGAAELGWSTEENRDWEDYKIRLGNQTPYLNKMNIKYYPSDRVDWAKN